MGYSLLLDDSKQIKVEDDTVTIKGGQTYGCVAMEVSLLTLDYLLSMLRVLSATYDMAIACLFVC